MTDPQPTYEYRVMCDETTVTKGGESIAALPTAERVRAVTRSTKGCAVSDSDFRVVLVQRLAEADKAHGMKKPNETRVLVWFECISCPVDEVGPGYCFVCGRKLVRREKEIHGRA